MFTKILIANRGEIACRVIKTAKKLGIATVAVYSEIDAHALHVKLADEAYCIGPAPAAQSYLCAEKIIKVAKESKAQAIHPGYGFLSEDTNFANTCAAENIIFIGPSAQAIAAMGDKSAAKNLMQQSNVPIIPGYQGKEQDYQTLLSEAEKIGFPLLVKATAGGGGKGMRLVLSSAELKDAIESSKREAKSSFGNDHVFLEKYIETARHVEVQIILDQQSNGLYLFDRDCSMQRRHQKVIEEAPAPNIDNALRKKMGETAVLAGKSIDYVGAGTIEFLLAPDGHYYFMEMNTRLQVEHPVTEMITGVDLVEWQLMVADKQTLPLKQDELQINGHAFEARICAENPFKNFAPSTGKLSTLIFPAESNPTEQQQVRIDTGVVQGDSITPYYDPMIAKLITHAQDRQTALALLKEQLEKTYIVGVDSNVSLLHRITAHQEFQAINIYTNFIDDHKDNLLAATEQLPEIISTIAGISEIKWQQEQSKQMAARSEDSDSPWFLRDSWRLTEKAKTPLRFWFQGEKVKLSLDYDVINKQAQWHNNHNLSVTIDGQQIHATVIRQSDSLHIFHHGQHYQLFFYNPNNTANGKGSADARFIAPMPGTVTEIFVEPGQSVKAGEKLMIIEAMKMEHTISAPEEGLIKNIHFKVGDLLNEGAELLEFEG